MEIIIVVIVGFLLSGVVVGITDKIEEKYGYKDEELEN